MVGHIRQMHFVLFFSYLCKMENEINLTNYLPEAKEAGFRAAEKRRESYSLARDLKAKEDNEAIAVRLAKESKQQG